MIKAPRSVHQIVYAIEDSAILLPKLVELTELAVKLAAEADKRLADASALEREAQAKERAEQRKKTADEKSARRLADREAARAAAISRGPRRDKGLPYQIDQIIATEYEVGPDFACTISAFHATMTSVLENMPRAWNLLAVETAFDKSRFPIKNGVIKGLKHLRDKQDPTLFSRFEGTTNG